MASAPLSDAVKALSRFLVAESSMGDTLQRVAEITERAIAPVRFVGITMLDDKGNATTAIYTDAESPEIDAAQYESGRGPCLDAWRERKPVRVDDTESVEAYPEFGAAAAARGILSTLSLPLAVGEKSIGAVNLYASEKMAFTEEDEEVAADLAIAAAVVLSNTAAYWGAYELTQHMNTAMQSRAVIEQAKGMLMAQAPNLSADDAFDLLVRASQRENIKLRDIAQRIVERRAPPKAL